MQTILDWARNVDSRSIVVACAARSFAPQRITNDRQGIRTCCAACPWQPLGDRIDGSYHELWPIWPTPPGCSVRHPSRVLRRYGQGVGQRARPIASTPR